MKENCYQFTVDQLRKENFLLIHTISSIRVVPPSLKKVALKHFYSRLNKAKKSSAHK